MRPAKTIVVGVDGSAESRAALGYALHEATLRDASVRVVAVFESLGLFGARYSIPIPVSDDEVAKRVEGDTWALIEEVVEDRGRCPDVTVVALASGNPARALIEEAEAAELLVIGHRGRGGMSSLLLGSVALRCVLHARCPVAVVRPSAHGRTGRMPEETFADVRTAPAAD